MRLTEHGQPRCYSTSEFYGPCDFPPELVEMRTSGPHFDYEGSPAYLCPAQDRSNVVQLVIAGKVIEDKPETCGVPIDHVTAQLLTTKDS